MGACRQDKHTVKLTLTHTKKGEREHKGQTMAAAEA